MKLTQLKRSRLLAGLSQQELATKLGVSQPTYQRWESGANEIPSAKLRKLGKILNVAIELLEGKIPPFDYLGYDRNFEDDRRYFGEVVFHFAGGGKPLIIPISIAQRKILLDQFKRNLRFPRVSSLDNRTVIVRLQAVADIFFSSEAYDDFGPEAEIYEHGPGPFPDDLFWEVIEHIEDPDALDEFPPDLVKDVLERAILTNEQLEELIKAGKVPEEARGKVREEADKLSDQLSEFANAVVWQLSNGAVRSVYFDTDSDILSAASDLEMLEADEFEILYFNAEGYHRNIFVNPNVVDYFAFPTHRLNRGIAAEMEQSIDSK